MNEWVQMANERSATRKQTLAILGASLQFVGVFLPIVSVPFLGTQNYFQNGKGDGIIVLVLAVTSIVLAIARLFPGLWVTGLSSVGLLLFTLFNFINNMDRVREQMKTGISADNPFGKLVGGLADAALNSIQLQWGWAVLMLGGILIVLAAAIRIPQGSPVLVSGPHPYRRYRLEEPSGPSGFVIAGVVLVVLLLALAAIPDIRHQFSASFAKAYANARATRSSEEQPAAGITSRQPLTTHQAAQGNDIDSDALTKLKSYRNARFGFSITYPGYFKALPGPDNGDGQAFVTEDGITLSVGGANLDPGDSLITEEASAVKDVPGATMADISPQGENAFILSWQNETEIGVIVEYVGSASKNILKLAIPPDNGLRTHRNKDFYGKLSYQLSSSFHHGDLESSW
jgi:hypothetical protein